MATISTSLQLFDQLSATLNRAQQPMNRTIIVAERLRSVLSAPFPLELQTADVSSRLVELRQSIEHSISFITVHFDFQVSQQLESLFINLQRVVMRLVNAMGRMQTQGGADAQQLQDALERVVELETQISDLQQKINGQMDQGGSSAGGWLSGLKKMASGLAGLKGMASNIDWKKLTGNGVQLQRQENLMGARTGNYQLGEGLFATMASQGDELGVTAKELGAAWNGFLPLAQNVGQLKQMVEWTSRLTNLDPSLGFKGAADAMKEILKGDPKSLVDKFQLSPALADPLKNAAKSGDFNAIGAEMEKVFGKLNMSKGQAAAFDALPLNQLTGDLAVLSNHIDIFFKNAVQMAAQAYVWFKERIPAALQSIGDTFGAMWGRVQPVLAFLAQSIAIAGVAFLTFLLIVSLVNGSLVGMIVSYALLGYEAVAAAIMAAASWVAANWPLLLLIVIIAGVIAAFVYFGGTVSQVVGAIVGSLFFLGAVIWDAIALVLKLVIDIVLMLVECFMMLALDVVRGAEMIGDALMAGFVGVIDLAIKGVNQLIKLLNLIPGVDIPEIPNMEQLFGPRQKVDLGGNKVEGWTRDLDAFRQKAVNGIPLANPVDAYKTGYGYGEGMTDSAINGVGSLAGKLKGAAGDVFGGIGDQFGIGQGVPDSTLLGGSLPGGAGPENGMNINRVNEVGSINDTVDISNENLKVMRELADLRSIQNFVTLTPTVQVSTGDIHEQANVDEMIRQIEVKLSNEISTSAQGVYA